MSQASTFDENLSSCNDSVPFSSSSPATKPHALNLSRPPAQSEMLAFPMHMPPVTSQMQKSSSRNDRSGRKIMRSKILIALAVALLTGLAAAQEGRSEISLQGTGFFTKDATGNGNLQRGSDTGGFLVGYRYHFNRWLAAESVYGYDRNTQQFSAPSSVSRVQSNIHQATGDSW